jgi:hypothetical protein
MGLRCVGRRKALPLAMDPQHRLSTQDSECWFRTVGGLLFGGLHFGDRGFSGAGQSWYVIDLFVRSYADSPILAWLWLQSAGLRCLRYSTSYSILNDPSPEACRGHHVRDTTGLRRCASLSKGLMGYWTFDRHLLDAGGFLARNVYCFLLLLSDSV